MVVTKQQLIQLVSQTFHNFNENYSHLTSKGKCTKTAINSSEDFDIVSEVLNWRSIAQTMSEVETSKLLRIRWLRDTFELKLGDNANYFKMILITNICVNEEMKTFFLKQNICRLHRMAIFIILPSKQVRRISIFIYKPFT